MASEIKNVGKNGYGKAVGFFEDFVKFINRGNVVDLAIAVIIGAAFGAIVTSLVNDIFSPILALIGGQGTLEECFVVLRYKNDSDRAIYPTIQKAKDAGAITLNYGRFIQTIIHFILISFVIFLIVKLVYFFYRKKEVKSTDWPCPKCLEMVKEGAVRCSHCTSEPISKNMETKIE